MRKFKSILSVILLVSAVSSMSALEIDLGDVIGEIDPKSTSTTKKEKTYSGTNALAPVKEAELDEDDDYKSILYIKSNVSNAEVYLNGVYKGTTSLTLKDLRPGKYRLELRKEFYDCDEYTITVRDGYALTYEVYMKEIQGTINFKNIPSEAMVYLDGSRNYHSSVDIIAGDHTVKIRRFGYEDYEKKFFLNPYSTVNISPEFKECAFEIRDFQVNREEINPEYSGAVGKAKVYFYVTARETATISVFAPDGTMTNTYDFPEFTEWEQGYTWNGCSDDGKMLDNGLYWIELDCAGKIHRLSVSINKDLNYPMMNFTASGFGYGRAPALEPVTMGYCDLAVSASPLFVNDRLNSTGVDASFAGSIGKHFSMGGYFNSHLRAADFAFAAGGNIRYSDFYEVAPGMKFNFALFGRYGYGENLSSYECDTGAGLGAGVLAGCSTKTASLTGGLQFIASPETGIFAENYNVIQGSVAAAAKITKKIVVYGYGMCNTKYAGAAGAGLNVMPFGSVVVLNAGLDTGFHLSDKDVNAALKIGLSFVF